MAPMSSTIASVSRNSFRLDGTRGPSSASTPTANAMSVAIGIAQPSSPLPPSVDGHEERAPGPPCRRARRSAGSAARLTVAQLAGHELALDLEPDDEEEHRHERVVHPVHQRLGDGEVAGPDGELVVPPARVARGVGVGPHERGGRGQQQHDAARRLERHEVAADRRRGLAEHRDADVAAAGIGEANRKPRRRRRASNVAAGWRLARTVALRAGPGGTEEHDATSRATGRGWRCGVVALVVGHGCAGVRDDAPRRPSTTEPVTTDADDGRPSTPAPTPTAPDTDSTRHDGARATTAPTRPHRTRPRPTLTAPGRRPAAAADAPAALVDPSLTVTPSTGLVHLQTVTIVRHRLHTEHWRRLGRVQEQQLRRRRRLRHQPHRHRQHRLVRCVQRAVRGAPHPAHARTATSTARPRRERATSVSAKISATTPSTRARRSPSIRTRRCRHRPRCSRGRLTDLRRR